MQPTSGTTRKDRSARRQASWTEAVTTRAAWAMVSALCLLTGLLVAAVLTATPARSVCVAIVEPCLSAAATAAPVGFEDRPR